MTISFDANLTSTAKIAQYPVANIRIINSRKSKSVDFSDASLFPTKNTDSDHTSKHQETNQIKDTNTKKTKTQESLEDEDGNGESFGMVLMSRSLSVSSSTSGFQSAMKRAFSLRRSSSVSERYCRIHDQSVTLTSPIDDDEVGDTMSGTRRPVKKSKYKGGKILKACKRLFGFGL